MENKSKPAFPTECSHDESGKIGESFQTGNTNAVYPGLTKREYFAGLAMQGLCANTIQGTDYDLDLLIKEAIQMSDALLIELSKTQ